LLINIHANRFAVGGAEEESPGSGGQAGEGHLETHVQEWTTGLIGLRTRAAIAGCEEHELPIPEGLDGEGERAPGPHPKTRTRGPQVDRWSDLHRGLYCGQ